MAITDERLARLAEQYFGGRGRAAHVMSCDDCHVDGDTHYVCPNHPDRRDPRERLYDVRTAPLRRA